jgi:hypothetical protein
LSRRPESQDDAGGRPDIPLRKRCPAATLPAGDLAEPQETRTVTTRPNKPAAARKAGITEQLMDAMRDSGMTPYAISKAAGVNRSVTCRFVNGERSVTCPTVERIAGALGLDLVLQPRNKDSLP